MEEILGENSQTPSGESSARQTPQPSANQPIINKEVQAAFAKQVLQVSFPFNGFSLFEIQQK